jgi:hypothetical protein
MNPKANCAKLAAPPVWLTMSPGPVDPCPTNPATLNFLPWSDTAHLHMTPVQFFDPVLNSWTIFVWGENSQLHKWKVSSMGNLTYVAQSHEYVSANVRETHPGGMLGGFCAGSSVALGSNSPICYFRLSMFSTIWGICFSLKANLNSLKASGSGTVVTQAKRLFVVYLKSAVTAGVSELVTTRLRSSP